MHRLKAVCLTSFYAVCVVWAGIPDAWANESTQGKSYFLLSGGDLPAISNLRSAVNSQNRDLILVELNKLKVARNKAEILPYVQCLWREQEEADPELNWEVVRLPFVKVEVANILLQAIRNGFIRSDIQEYREYVTRYVFDNDAALASNSILTLSIANDGRDVPLLLEAARRENPRTFGAAVLALSYMCHATAAEALDSLENDAIDEGPKDYLSGATPRQYIQETRASAESVRAFYAGNCS